MVWNVRLCEGCARTFGRDGESVNSRCPHCGSAASKVISKHLKASDARDAVSMSNVPLEIRGELSAWMAKEKLRDAPIPVQSIDGARVLLDASDENRIVTLEMIEIAISNQNSVMDAESFIEQACAEGQLLRLADGTWQRI